jgi:phosphate starvation-inducible membrane PsiE
MKISKVDVDKLGNGLVAVFHRLALFAIGLVTVWAAGHTFYEIFQKEYASITDLLLLFIYLEIGAMVGIYFKTNHMPVRFLMYIAITALTRHMVDIMSHVPINLWEMVALGGTIFILALSVVIIRYASYKFPSDNKPEDPKIS